MVHLKIPSNSDAFFRMLFQQNTKFWCPYAEIWIPNESQMNEIESNESCIRTYTGAIKLATARDNNSDTNTYLLQQAQDNYKDCGVWQLTILRIIGHEYMLFPFVWWMEHSIVNGFWFCVTSLTHEAYVDWILLTRCLQWIAPLVPFLAGRAEAVLLLGRRRLQHLETQ